MRCARDRPPTRAALRKIPRGPRPKSRWYPRRRASRGRRPCGASLLRSGGWCAMRCRCARRSAVMSARPGCVCATTALPLRKKSCADILGNRALFGQHHLHAVRERADGALGPGDGTLGPERAELFVECSCGDGWRLSASLRHLQGRRGRRTSTARFFGTRYFCATAWTCAGVTARKPSRIVLMRCGSPSNSVKQAR